MRTNIEQTNRMGYRLFWVGAIWAILWGVVISVWLGYGYFVMTLEELNQTIWAVPGKLFIVWSFSVPLSSVLVGMGMLRYAGARSAKAWLIGLGLVLTMIMMGVIASTFGHFPWLFGIGGTLILLCFLGIVWFWAKERMALKESATAAADLKLLGYIFMLTAAWFTCGVASFQFENAFADQNPSSPMLVMIPLLLGWLFLFLSHYKSRQQHALAGP